MDGVHDLGGVQGFGAVVSAPDEQPYAERWEGRLHGMMVTLEVTGRLPDGFRYAIERMDPVEYLASPYYEHWLVALETLLTEAGVITAGELEARAEAAGAGDLPPADDPALARRVRTALTARTPAQEHSVGRRFRPGDAVAVRRMAPAGHTRCPRYLRGARGEIRRLLPPAPLPDVRLTGEVRPESCYTVAFHGEELWAPDAEPGVTVLADLWESYLVPAASPGAVS